MKKIIAAALVALTLSACSPQRALDEADRLCRDGVEYLAFTKMNTSGDISYSIVPHLKPDGSLYTCKREGQA